MAGEIEEIAGAADYSCIASGDLDATERVITETQRWRRDRIKAQQDVPHLREAGRTRKLGVTIIGGAVARVSVI